MEAINLCGLQTYQIITDFQLGLEQRQLPSQKEKILKRLVRVGRIILFLVDHLLRHSTSPPKCRKALIGVFSLKEGSPPSDQVRDLAL